MYATDRRQTSDRRRTKASLNAPAWGAGRNKCWWAWCSPVRSTPRSQTNATFHQQDIKQLKKESYLTILFVHFKKKLEKMMTRFLYHLTSRISTYVRCCALWPLFPSSSVWLTLWQLALQHIMRFTMSTRVRYSSWSCIQQYNTHLLLLFITKSYKYLSLCFNGHFPGGTGLASTRMSPFWILLELRMMEVVVDTWSYKTCYDLTPVKSSPPTNQHPVLSIGRIALPVAQPTVSKHWREIVQVYNKI